MGITNVIDIRYSVYTVRSTAVVKSTLTIILYVHKIIFNYIAYYDILIIKPVNMSFLWISSNIMDMPQLKIIS